MRLMTSGPIGPVTSGALARDSPILGAYVTSRGELVLGWLGWLVSLFTVAVDAAGINIVY